MSIKLLLVLPVIVITTLISNAKTAAEQVQTSRIEAQQHTIQQQKADKLVAQAKVAKAAADKEAADKAAADAANKAAQDAQAAQAAKVSAVAQNTAQGVSMSATAIMDAAGIPQGDRAAVNYIISHESGWRHLVVNSEGSGATGLCQALPGSKMASAGADWATNPVTQMRWCNSYAISRYGSWAGAYNFWVANKWW